MDPLESYLQQCQRHPAAIMPLNAFVAAFREQLPPDLRPAWRRGRIVARLVELGYKIGLIERTNHVAGVATGSWTASGGHLTLA